MGAMKLVRKLHKGEEEVVVEMMRGLKDNSMLKLQLEQVWHGESTRNSTLL